VPAATAADATTEAVAMTDSPRTAHRRPRGIDRISVALFSAAGFFVVLALLATQLQPTAFGNVRQPAAAVRKLYVTKVIETIADGRGPDSSSSSNPVASSTAAPAAPAAPVTGSS
jgi:hypothetical protein